MKRHTFLGRDRLLEMERGGGGPNPFLRFAREIACFHHERWDGSGYPEGLRGDDIPVSARVTAVADVYDALVNRRVYKSAMPHDRALELIQEGRGKHFDADIVDAFVGIEHDVRKLSRHLAGPGRYSEAGAAERSWERNSR